MYEEIRERIDKIHKNFVIIDGHFDLLMDVLEKRELGFKKVIEREHLPNFIEGGINIIVSSIFIEDIFLPEMALRRALDQISALYEEIEESKDKIVLCKSYDDIMKSVKENKLGILLSFEGVEPIGNDLKLLRIFYELGVRIIGLVWSRRNYAADGCYFSKKEEGKKGGLTSFGVELIKEAEKLGMLIDVSHLNDEGFWDVINIAKNPIIASHSNSRTLANSMRNLDDEQIKALTAKGGVIGMNVCNAFVSDNDEECDADHLVNHVDNIVKIAGIEHVGLGFDFCDFIRAKQPEKAEKPKRKTFDIIKGHKNIREFTEALIKHGYNDDEIELILGRNFLRIYKNIF
ncbi:membrane dipeptidase [Caminicella sporogenes DSM 14501]|uniref:Membrane dipeptidase n=1 Tax=Caminicella sporogenes DSM 14501 TaxID=1121266 RepID=A0A1M6PBM8_9FIRM|nr:dipeptidase [Caminicella sporogenes]RKD21461.1 membrane dipeptidase [Caminicella sporogenes]SHK05327.1 membrane dipeptidase [Caminicella sporogenes DSM 14501]